MTDDPTTSQTTSEPQGSNSPLSAASTTTPRDNSAATEPTSEPLVKDAPEPDADAGNEASEATPPDHDTPAPALEPLNPAVVMPGSLSIASRLELALEDRVLLLERELHLLREQFAWPTKEPQ